MGVNVLGQLGDGNASIAGYRRGCQARRCRPQPRRGRHGAPRAWGWKVLGQLGDGTTVDRTVAVPVPGLPPASVVAAGIAHSLVL